MRSRFCCMFDLYLGPIPVTIRPDNALQPPPIVVVTLNPAFDLVLEVPDFQVGSHQRGRQLHRLPAGKGLNVSRTLDTLGTSSIITGFLGQESMAEFERVLVNTRITGQFFAVPGYTRQNVTILEPSRSTDTHIRQQGSEINKHDIERIGSKLGLLAEKGTLVVFAGSLPPGVSPADLAHLMRICSQDGARIILDASGQNLAATIDQRPWLIKPNRKEFAQLTGRPDQPLEQIARTARELTERVQNVLISLGPQGALLITKHLAIRAVMDSTGATAVVNTVGSGDSLLAAFLAEMVRGQDIQTSLSHAVAVSWAACQTSLPAVFDPELAKRTHNQIRLEQIEGL